MEVCSVDGCSARLYSGILCSRHYERLRTTGTVADGPRARASWQDRLWRQVRKGAADECWPWVGKSKVKGYGTLERGGRRGGKVLAHRAAWESVNGPIPQGEGAHGTVVMHICDNRACCNPAHLRLGTQADNIADMNDKSRSSMPITRGERHHKAVLTEEMVRLIRASHLKPSELAKQLGIDRKVIGLAKRGITWKWLDNPEPARD